MVQIARLVVIAVLVAGCGKKSSTGEAVGSGSSGSAKAEVVAPPVGSAAPSAGDKAKVVKKKAGKGGAKAEGAAAEPDCGFGASGFLMKRCGGQCLDTAVDPNNCGFCGVVCSSGKCSLSACDL